MEDIDNIIASIPLLKGQRWNQFILEGWTNRSLHLQSAYQSYVLRIPLHPWTNGIDRCREYVNLQRIIPLNLRPPALYFDSVTGTQLRDYIEGEVLAIQELTPYILQLCSEVLHRLHDSDIQFEPIDMLERLVHDSAQLREQGVQLDSRYDILFAYCESIRAQVSCDKMVPCHMDPNLYNFILGERLWVIDFEYAHQYDRAWDLAYFITCARLSPEQEQTFREAYAGDQSLWERVRLYKPVTQLSQAIWVHQQLILGQSSVREKTLLDWEQGALAYAISFL